MTPRPRRCCVSTGAEPAIGMAGMNRQIRLVGIGIMVLFVALFVQLNWLQIVHARALEANPLNSRAVVKEYTAKRGDIVSADGVTLATSVPTNDQFKYLRQYPTGALFEQITGYFSFTYGSDGVERTYDKVLTGAAARSSCRPASASCATCSPTTTRASRSPSPSSTSCRRSPRPSWPGGWARWWPSTRRTGAILAMYSNPSFDPNLLSGHDQTQVQANYKALTATPGECWPRRLPAALVPRAPRSRSSPRRRSTTTSRPWPPRCTRPWRPCRCRRPPTCCTTSAARCAAASCRSCSRCRATPASARSGWTWGPRPCTLKPTSFGFNQTPPIDLPFPAQSTFPAAASFAQDQPGLAFSAIGQQDVQATPLEMAMVAGAIADGGTIMTPHVLGHVTNSQNQVVSTYQPKPWLQATSPATAAQLTQLMLSVVNSPERHRGGGPDPGVEVAGKTGTAQTGTGQDRRLVRGVRPGRQPDDRRRGRAPQPAVGQRVPGRHPRRPDRQGHDRGLPHGRQPDCDPSPVHPAAAPPRPS